MISDLDRIFYWALVLIGTWGIILAAIRLREWWRNHIRPDPLAPEIPVYFTVWGKLR